MATVRLHKNILDEKFDTFFVENGLSVENIIRNHTDGKSYDGMLIECYDLETGKTYFSTIEDDTATTNAVVLVNGKDSNLNYEVQSNDVIEIVITPAGNWSWPGAGIGAGIGGVVGTVIGGVMGVAMAANPVAILIGVLVGAALGAATGFVIGGLIGNSFNKEKTKSNKGLESKALPDVRGATNQPITDKTFPMVLGKHLTTPFIIGSTWNEISGNRGQTNYIHALYVVGYAPLRLTDFKLGDMFLAHNQRWGEHTDMKNIFHGALTGKDDGTEGSGDIVNTWHNNDITLEILQQDQNGGEIDWGTVYPWAKLQQDVEANVLYIADGSLEEIDRANAITYKGLGLSNGLRNNPVYYSEKFPKSLKVELNFANGLYKTRSETHDKTSSVYYRKIPLWTAIQWRVYSDDNIPSDGQNAGTGPIPEYDYDKKVYKSNKRYWNSFTSINGNLSSEVFDQSKRNADIDEHTGNRLKINGVYTDINTGWYGAQVFNFQPLGGTNEDQEGINEIRCITQVDLIEWARENLCTESERDNDVILAEKTRAYFFDSSNSTKSVEVRVVRISPCYIDETVSNQDNSAYTFNDIFTWKTLTSEVLDGDKLLQQSVIEQKRPVPDYWMRKLCIVSLRAKTDEVDQLTNTIKKFTCTAESFAPYYDEEQKKWFPENVNTITKYIRPDGTEITKEQFEADRQANPQIKSKSYAAGNDFVSNLVNNIIRINEHKDASNRYFIPYKDKDQSGNYLPGCDGTMLYNTNNVASIFLLAGIGPHLGVDALGYLQDFYDGSGELKKSAGDFNMGQLAKWYVWANKVTDGTTYSSKGHHFDHDGNQQWHEAGDLVEIYFSANAYLYQAESLEGIFNKITTAGRAVFTRDNKGRFTIKIDKKEGYPVALINQQNTLKSSYTISYAELPSGLQMTFSDENDGYEQNQFFCMADGEDPKHPHGAIEQYSVPFVTNREQQYSLGRYLLANRLLTKEIVTKQIGIEGYSLSIGDVVLLQDDTMLIGTDSGGRITKLIETPSLIYGFIINNTYKYTGEEEEFTDSNSLTQTRCKQGVVIMQPSQYKESRIITIRLAKNNTSCTVDEVTYTLLKGDTNLVLFDVPIAKDAGVQDGSQYYIYKPEIDNIVGFGIVGQVTAKYRITKIKPDAKHNHELTLVRYNEDLYNFGDQLPSFQNTMTIPDRSGENAFALSANTTNDDMTKAISNTVNVSTKNMIASFAATPPAPTSFKITPQKDLIEFRSTIIAQELNNVDHVEYKITRPDNSVVTVSGKTTAYYYFDRNLDGFPEAGDFNDWTFEARSVAMYTDEHGVSPSSSYVTGTLDLDYYGTWHIPDITVSTEVVDRTAIMTAVHSEKIDVYGIEQTLVKIKRIGNQEVVDGVSFNTLLGIQPDTEFYEPEFKKAVEYTETGDNEDNYCNKYPEVTTMPVSPERGDVVHYLGETTEYYTQGKYYRYNGTSWAEYSIDYKSTTNKITHTLPLIGQTIRIFREDGTYTGVFSKDVPDVETISELPHDPPQEGDVIHWIGQDRTEAPAFKNGGYYIYENSEWNKAISKSSMVKTHYVYSIRMTNESGYITNEVLVDVYAKSTGIADIVHSHEYYKDLYVEKLSAINANLGMVSQGGMGEFDKMQNCWALSDLTAEDSGVPGGVLKGTFRVGDDNEYFKVTPRIDPDDPTKRHYTIELKAGNIELTSDVGGGSELDFTNGTYVYNADKTARLAITPSGIIAQKQIATLVVPVGTENPSFLGWYEIINGRYVVTTDIVVDPNKGYYTVKWDEQARVIADERGNMILSNSRETPPFGYTVEGADIYHFEDENHPEYAEDSTLNPQSLSFTGEVVDTIDSQPLLLVASSSKCFSGNITKDISNFEGRMVFLTKSDSIKVDRFINIDGTQTATAETYNTEMSAAKGGSTVGAYLGLTAQQISDGLFEGV